MDIDSLPELFIEQVRLFQEKAGHEPHAFKLAKKLNIRMKLGPANMAFPEMNPPAIMLQPEYFAGNNDVVRHELNHILLYWCEMEAEILHAYGLDEGQAIVERLCWQAIAHLTVPQPIVDEAVRLHGVSPQAVLHIRQATGCTLDVALKRLVHDRPHNKRAGFVLTREYVSQVEVCNWRLPFWHLDKVSDDALPAQVAPIRHNLRLGVVGR